MKWTTLFLFLSLSLNSQSPLLKIEEAGKYGFINLDGDIVISPKYANAFNFSEGLGAVRLTDKFGFIDSTGTWKIPPLYDYATPFKNGKASVWLGSKQMQISPSGITSPKHEYGKRNRAPSGFVILKSTDRKIGVANDNGAVVLDTIYHQIQWWTDGYYNLSKKKIVDGEELLERGVADTLGNVLIPFGKYEKIKPIGEGWFYVTKYEANPDEKKRRDRITKNAGILQVNDGVFRPITDPHFMYIEGRFSDGTITAKFIDASSNSNPSYAGYIDTTGQVLFADFNIRHAYPFLGGFAFVSDGEDKKTYLIDKNGARLNNIGIKKLSSSAVRRPRNSRIPAKDYFINGWTIVNTDNGIARLNKKGEVQLIKELEGMYFGYFEEDRYLHVISKRKQSKPLYRSVYDVISMELLPFRFEMIRPEMYGNKLFFIEENNRSAYVDTSGNIVWQQKEPLVFYPYDVVHRPILKPRKQKPKKMHWLYRLLNWNPKAYIGFRKKTFQEKGKNYPANNLYLMNPTNDTLVFDAGHTGRIPLKLQAKDAKGKWQTINHFGPTCVMSRRKIKRKLPPRHYWYYRLPIFKGHVETEFRVVIPYTKKGEPDVVLEMVKEFRGGINPGQFWRS